MGRVFSLLAIIAFALSLGMGSVVHAVEPVACAGELQASTDHADENSDQDKDNGDHAAMHQHGGCHGHHLSVAPSSATAPANGTAKGEIQALIDTILAQNGAYPALRPPIA